MLRNMCSCVQNYRVFITSNDRIALNCSFIRSSCSPYREYYTIFSVEIFLHVINGGYGYLSWIFVERAFARSLERGGAIMAEGARLFDGGLLEQTKAESRFYRRLMPRPRG